MLFTDKDEKPKNKYFLTTSAGYDENGKYFEKTDICENSNPIRTVATFNYIIESTFNDDESIERLVELYKDENFKK